MKANVKKSIMASVLGLGLMVGGGVTFANWTVSRELAPTAITVGQIAVVDAATANLIWTIQPTGGTATNWDPASTTRRPRPGDTIRATWSGTAQTNVPVQLNVTRGTAPAAVTGITNTVTTVPASSQAITANTVISVTYEIVVDDTAAQGATINLQPVTFQLTTAG